MVPTEDFVLIAGPYIPYFRYTKTSSYIELAAW